MMFDLNKGFFSTPKHTIHPALAHLLFWFPMKKVNYGKNKKGLNNKSWSDFFHSTFGDWLCFPSLSTACIFVHNIYLPNIFNSILLLFSCYCFFFSLLLRSSISGMQSMQRWTMKERQTKYPKKKNPLAMISIAIANCHCRHTVHSIIYMRWCYLYFLLLLVLCLVFFSNFSINKRWIHIVALNQPHELKSCQMKKLQDSKMNHKTIFNQPSTMDSGRT